MEDVLHKKGWLQKTAQMASKAHKIMLDAMEAVHKTASKLRKL
jgi:hypothetical protein